MASGLAMDQAFLPRSIWTGDSKVLPSELHTSVVVTRGIPAGASFGPCLLQNTFHDTIAFIAQKSCDKINKSYVFRVDPEATRSSALVLSWLRLVQAARNRDEQNAEAYLRAGQLHVRTTRHVGQDEELLVWYDQELSHLLGFTDMTTRAHNGEFKCAKCDQVFKNEHPFLAHCRFLCAQVKGDAWGSDAHRYAQVKSDAWGSDAHRYAQVKSDAWGRDAHRYAQVKSDALGREAHRYAEVKSDAWDREAQRHAEVKSDAHRHAEVKSGAWVREAHRHAEAKRPRRVTDFHNIARDLEHKHSGTDEDVAVSPKKKKYDETVCPRGRKSVLLEKTNISNDDNITHLTRDQHPAAPEVSVSVSKARTDRLKNDPSECKNGALPEVGDTKGGFTHDKERPAGEEDRGSEETGEGSGLRPAGSSAFSLVLSSGHGEQKSAFCKPSKRTSPTDSPRVPTAGRLEEMADLFSPRAVLGYSNLLTQSMLARDPTPVTMGNAFHYAPEHWSRSIGAQLQTPSPSSSSSSSLTILPPTFTSFGVSVQNWCAKCNLSFRMTSDLVFHMRSHHKKEFAVESQVRRRREEKLTCPICHEYFRERHHLSRHMTSHN